MPNLFDRLYGEADAIVQDEIARRGQGSLLDAMRTVTAPAILDLIAKGRTNAAARWVTRLDGAVAWRNAGRVLGTHALARKVAGLLLDGGFAAKARMLWKAIVVARFKSYWIGTKDIQRYEGHYEGKRLPKDVVAFLAQSRELTDDVRTAFFEGVKEYIRLCDRHRWPREAERVATMAEGVEARRPPRTSSAPSPNKMKKMNPQWFRRLLAAARRDARSDEWMCDRLADSLEGISVTAVEAFKRIYLAEATKRLSALRERAGRDLSPDEAEDVATSVIALGAKAATNAAAIRQALKANRAARGGPAFAFEAPDLTYVNLVWYPANLFVRIKNDLAG